MDDDTVPVGAYRPVALPGPVTVASGTFYSHRGEVYPFRSGYEFLSKDSVSRPSNWSNRAALHLAEQACGSRIAEVIGLRHTGHTSSLISLFPGGL